MNDPLHPRLRPTHLTARPARPSTKYQEHPVQRGPGGQPRPTLESADQTVSAQHIRLRAWIEAKPLDG